MTTLEFKWEDIDSLEQLKLGDELEYKCSGPNKEFKYWGTVIDIQRNDIQRNSGSPIVVRMEGDWNLVPSSLTAKDNKLTRKVAVFVWPEYFGACVKATKDDSVGHYVRIDETHPNQWVRAETGEFFATWELELVCSNYTLNVLGRGY